MIGSLGDEVVAQRQGAEDKGVKHVLCVGAAMAVVGDTQVARVGSRRVREARVPLIDEFTVGIQGELVGFQQIDVTLLQLLIRMILGHDSLIVTQFVIDGEHLTTHGNDIPHGCPGVIVDVFLKAPDSEGVRVSHPEDGIVIVILQTVPRVPDLDAINLTELVLIVPPVVHAEITDVQGVCGLGDFQLRFGIPRADHLLVVLVEVIIDNDRVRRCIPGVGEERIHLEGNHVRHIYLLEVCERHVGIGGNGDFIHAVLERRQQSRELAGGAVGGDIDVACVVLFFQLGAGPGATLDGVGVLRLEEAFLGAAVLGALLTVEAEVGVVQREADGGRTYIVQ